MINALETPPTAFELFVDRWEVDPELREEVIALHEEGFLQEEE